MKNTKTCPAASRWPLTEVRPSTRCQVPKENQRLQVPPAPRVRTSTVTLNVAWSNTEGWLVTVADAGQIDTQTNQIPVAPAEGADDESAK